MTKIYLSKLDAAKRQLDTAIELFFHSGDSVSILGLASAAKEVLETLLKKQGKKTYTELTMEYVKPDKRVRDYVRKQLDKPKNFIKHGSFDEKAVLEFNPSTIEYDLLFASYAYRELTKDSPLLVSAYITWFAMKRPELLLKAGDQTMASGMRTIVNPEEKAKYFNAYSEAYYKYRARRTAKQD